MRRAAMILGAVLGTWCAVQTAFGAAITVPESGALYGDVGSWGVTWGGSGIPTANSAYKEIYDNTNDYFIRIAMRAHGRYSYGATADPNDPIYWVESGKFGGTGPDQNYARWNFAFYVAVLDNNKNPVNNTSLYTVKLLYDFDPGTGTDASDHGSVSFGSSGLPSPSQDSWNLAMSFLASDASSTFGTIDAPSVAFNPNVNGQYTFRLAVYNSSGDDLGAVSMKVNAVPEPASMVALGGLGLVGAGWGFVRRRKLRGKA